MTLVSSDIIEVISELQSLNSLQSFSLGGGTNLALKFSHRRSIDIDLFCTENIGINGFREIEKEIQDHFKESVLSSLYPGGEEDTQYIFLRLLIKRNETTIKVEIIQNTKLLYPIEAINGIRVISTKDIGMMKLMASSYRGAHKDVYDLDFITETYSLLELCNNLKEKRNLYSAATDVSLFDQIEKKTPLDDPIMLLQFMKGSKGQKSRPGHSDGRVDLSVGAKSWTSAASSFRSKVRELCRQLGVDYPSPQDLSKF